ncbi:GtrA family protein [Sphingomonas sp. TREG-RG-20F-R18-01]|uniref:GtrA family protein n=1 Tax=Sphingomonas sp. TREG-RG-20F-R18-01 TaxID=2914982 RepID=UPI001F59B21A|nr:GtrA family protein [Sphingomonas sp. TREG-RG-20F-R18-01]
MASTSPAATPWLGAERRRFLVFLAVGGLNTLVGYGLFGLFLWLGLAPIAALAVATVGGVLFNFQSIGRIVFADGTMRRLPAFIAVYTVQFAVNAGALTLLRSAGLSPMLAQAVMVPLLAVGSFFAMRRFVYAGGAPRATDRQDAPGCYDLP